MTATPLRRPDSPPAADRTGPGRGGGAAARRPRPDGLDLGVDLHVASTMSYGRSGLAATVARAVAGGLREVGVADHVGPEPAWLDAYVATVRATDAASSLRVHCGLEIGVLDPAGRLDLPAAARPRLSRVDYVVLVPVSSAVFRRRSGRPEAERVVEDVLLASLRAAAGIPVPVVLAGSFAVLAPLGLDERDVPDDAVRELGWACARAGVAVEVTERWRTPSPRVARLLAGAGVALAAGSAARTAAEVGRWAHVRDVTTALDGVPRGFRPLPAPDGPDGPDGPAGPAGPAGLAGPAGPAGLTALTDRTDRGPDRPT